MVELVRAGRKAEVPQEILQNGAIYHCGPIVNEDCGKWRVSSAGPTTSSRLTEDGAELVENDVFRVVIGKGTMGSKMVKALRGKGVYLKAVGGCAVCYAGNIKSTDVRWLELGYPEAVWVLEMNRFGPLIVGIDAYGCSLSAEVMEKVFENAHKIYREEGLDPKVRYQQNPNTVAGFSLEEVIEFCRSQ
jgi:fumarate hydratase subunit beta